MTWEQDGHEVTMGLMICVRKGMGKMEVLGPEPTSIGELGWLPDNKVCRYQVHGIRLNGLVIMNFHGTALPVNKLDSEGRINQSKRIKSFAKKVTKDNDALIICGDFNLFPNTESIRLMAEGMKDLIADYEIETTRSRINPYYGSKSEQKYADFCFVKNVDISHFEVPLDVEASDHLPMYLNFSVCN